MAVPLSELSMKGHRDMNRDQVKGRTEQVKGAIKEGTGKVLDNERLEAEGKIDKTAGKAQAEYGDAKESVKDHIERTPAQPGLKRPVR